jgi:integrase
MLAKEYKPGKRPVTKVYKPGNINRILSTYRHVGNRLVEQGHITLPLPMVKLGALENRRERILEHEEEAALLNAALNDSNAYSWLFVKVGLSTGLRHTEIVSAQVIEGHRIRGLG